MAIPLMLHSRHAAPGPTYETYHDWVVPWRFTSMEAEHRALRTGVGLTDVSHLALVEVRGNDRVGFLHNLLSNDIKALKPGGGCQAALLTANAKLTAVVLVLMDTEAIWLLTDVTHAAIVAETLERFHFSEEVAITNHERRWVAMALQGPNTISVLEALNASVQLERPGAHLTTTLQEIPVRLISHSLIGGAGTICLVERSNAGRLWTALRDAGGAHGLELVGWGAMHTARIEAGVPWFGVDMDEDNLLPETGLETILASETKGCYLGQEVVARMATYGSANKRLVRVATEGTVVPEAKSAMLRGSDEVGWITSACHSIQRGQPLALGYVKRGAYEDGTRLTIRHGNTRIPATIQTRSNK